MEYRYIATSVTGFVQQVATGFLQHGYWFYVSGTIPEHKDPTKTDAKLLAKYGIDVSRNTRARRKQAGRANVQYLRLGRFFVLLATHGEHLFFDEEAGRVRDIRKSPLIVGGYSITYKRGNYKRKQPGHAKAEPDTKWHARVQIARETFRDLKAHFVDVSTRWSAERLARDIYHLPYEPYAPVRQQLHALLLTINRNRAVAGLPIVSPNILRWRRAIVRPFD